MIPVNVFIVDDEDSLRISLSDDLREQGYTVFEFPNAQAALDALEKSRPDVIFIDHLMPGMSGLDFVGIALKQYPDMTIVVMTAYGSVESAVKAIKLGAYDYITKPFDTKEILLLLDRIRELRQLKIQTAAWRSTAQGEFNVHAIIGASGETARLREKILLVADAATNVLIQGETGTGKELVANVIHNTSSRRDKSMIKLSCAVLSREMFESELFGHVKGAFTGAMRDKPGRFELADGGTLYLDDVDDIPFDLQVKLLRVLEEREFERVGDTKTLSVDVRILASTKKDLKQLASAGKFREDLLYRLNVFPIFLQPLRERRDDIPPLLEYWIAKYADGKHIRISADVLDILRAYSWPGNVRELRNLTERLVLMSRDGTIDIPLLPIDVSVGDALFPSGESRKALDQVLMDIERQMIKGTLSKCGGNKAQAARMLGLPVSTLRTRMEKHGLF